MSLDLGPIVAGIVALGGLSGIAALVYVVPTFRKLRGEASKLDVEAATLATSAEDAHDAAVDARYAQLLKAQVEHVVEPLKARVLDQEQRVQRLEADLLATTQKYREALRVIRLWRRWMDRHLEVHHHGDQEVGASWPAIPESIAPDVWWWA